MKRKFTRLADSRLSQSASKRSDAAQGLASFRPYLELTTCCCPCFRRPCRHRESSRVPETSPWQQSAPLPDGHSGLQAIRILAAGILGPIGSRQIGAPPCSWSAVGRGGSTVPTALLASPASGAADGAANPAQLILAASANPAHIAPVLGVRKTSLSTAQCGVGWYACAGTLSGNCARA